MEGLPPWMEQGMSVIEDPVAVADALRDFYLKVLAQTIQLLKTLQDRGP